MISDEETNIDDFNGSQEVHIPISTNVVQGDKEEGDPTFLKLFKYKKELKITECNRSACSQMIPIQTT